MEITTSPAKYGDTDNTLLLKIATLVQAGAGSDPLAGITFAMRLQTHNGNNVPLGLYQDAACTTPATEDFDLVAGWKDELSDSGIILTQSDSAKRPYLLFVDDVPTLQWDRVDDFLAGDSPSLSQPLNIAAAFSPDGLSGDRFICDGTASRVASFLFGNLPALFAGNVIVGSATNTDWQNTLIHFNGASSTIRQNGSQTATGNSGANALEDIVIGAAGDNTAAGLYGGGMVCVFVTPDITTGERDLIETAMQTLIP